MDPHGAMLSSTFASRGKAGAVLHRPSLCGVKIIPALLHLMPDPDLLQCVPGKHYPVLDLAAMMQARCPSTLPTVEKG